MKKIFLIIATAVFSIAGEAQNTLRPNLYLQRMNYYNPAAGINDSVFKRELSFYAKEKFVDKDNDAIWVKPATVYLNYLGALNGRDFLNLSYIFDGYSFYNRHSVNAGIGRTYTWGRSGRLGLGARAVLNIDKIDWDKITHIADRPSPGWHITPDLDLGAELQLGKLNLGLAAKNLLGSTVKADGSVLIKDWREVYVNAAYTFNLFNRKIAVTPFLLYFQERDFALDLGTNVSFFKIVDVSYALRLLELRSIVAAKLKLGKHLQIGVAADHSYLLSDVNTDLFIAYKF